MEDLKLGVLNACLEYLEEVRTFKNLINGSWKHNLIYRHWNPPNKIKDLGLVIYLTNSGFYVKELGSAGLPNFAMKTAKKRECWNCMNC